MTDKEKYELWQIETVKTLNSTMDIVRNTYTGHLMLYRKSAAENYPVMAEISKINHPNVMQVYDTVLDGRLCLSLCEYIPGVTLEEAVLNQHPYDEFQAKVIMKQLCAGLTQLHKHRIIHRDINPSNVMIKHDGTVKIIDFNITRIGNDYSRKDTRVLGTVGYAAPEQFGFEQTDERSDIYSCGVLLNFLLTGKHPDEQLYTGPLQKVILQCIQIDKDKRYESAEQISDVLRGARYSKERFLRPLPGFRSNNKFFKLITIAGFILYGLNLFSYITSLLVLHSTNALYSSSVQNIVYALGLDFFVFWSALPYCLFGDVFDLAPRISPKNPHKGRTILCVPGGLSFLAGSVILAIAISNF